MEPTVEWQQIVPAAIITFFLSSFFWLWWFARKGWIGHRAPKDPKSVPVDNEDLERLRRLLRVTHHKVVPPSDVLRMCVERVEEIVDNNGG